MANDRDHVACDRTSPADLVEPSHRLSGGPADHRSISPTLWAAYSFAMSEATVIFLFVPLWQFFVPTPGWVLFTWLNFQIIRNTMGHAEFEIFPRWWLDSPLTRWINTTVHHDLHHNGGFNTNYGLYFTWWDRWVGIEHPSYHEKLCEVTGRTQSIAARAIGKVTAQLSRNSGIE